MSDIYAGNHYLDLDPQQEKPQMKPQYKVTMEYMRSRVRDIQSQVSGTTTLVIVTLDNGYKFVGKAACVDPSLFDESIGYNLAINDAERQMWPVFGFLLAEVKHQFEQSEGTVELADMLAHFQIKE